MVDKLKSLVQMSEFIAANSTQTYENWTHFLQFSGRFYKYTYDEQISIYFQRPEATAVASYEIWNQQMRRYIKRGSVGIAVVDNSGNGTRLRYLFDIADTGTRQASRTPNIWKMNREHEQAVAQDLELSADFMRCSGPILGASLVWGIGFTSYSTFMGHMGTDAAAANSVAAVVRDIICCLSAGISSAAGIMIGNELGAGNLKRGNAWVWR